MLSVGNVALRLRLNTRRFLLSSTMGTRESSAQHKISSNAARVRSGVPVRHSHPPPPGQSEPARTAADGSERTQVSHVSSTPTAIELKVVTEESVDYDRKVAYKTGGEDKSMV